MERCEQCGGPLGDVKPGEEVYELPFKMALGNMAMQPVCRQCYLGAQQREAGPSGAADAAASDAVLALFLFDSDNPPPEAEVGYGAFAETALLRHLFEAWGQSSDQPLADTELKACHGDLFEQHILGDDACTLRILGRMMQASDVHTGLLEPDFCAAVESGQSVGLIPYAVGLSPLPGAAVNRIHAELSRQLPGFYVGAVAFSPSYVFEETASTLQLPQTMRIRGGECVGDWLGTAPDLPSPKQEAIPQHTTKVAPETVSQLQAKPAAPKRRGRPVFTFRDEKLGAEVTLEREGDGGIATIIEPDGAVREVVQFPSLNLGFWGAYRAGTGKLVLKDSTGRKWTFSLPTTDSDLFWKWYEAPVFPALPELMDEFSSALDELEAEGVPLDEAYVALEVPGPDDDETRPEDQDTSVLLILTRQELIVFRQAEPPHEFFAREYARFPFGQFRFVRGSGSAAYDMGIAMGGLGSQAVCRILDARDHCYFFSGHKTVIQAVLNRAG